MECSQELTEQRVRTAHSLLFLHGAASNVSFSNKSLILCVKRCIIFLLESAPETLSVRLRV